MFSVRDNVVREKSFADPQQASGSHSFVPTLTDDGVLFLAHRLREKESLGDLPRRRRWKFWKR